MDEISALSAVEKIKRRQLEEQVEERLENERAVLAARVSQLSEQLCGHSDALKDARSLHKEFQESKCRVLLSMLKICTRRDGKAVGRIIRELLRTGVTSTECMQHLRESFGRTILTEPWMLNAFVNIAAFKIRIEGLRHRLVQQKREAAGAMGVERSRLMSMTQSVMSHSSSPIWTSTEGWRRATCRLVNDIKPLTRSEGPPLPDETRTSAGSLSVQQHLPEEVTSQLSFLSRTSSLFPVDGPPDMSEPLEPMPMSEFMTDVHRTEDSLAETRRELEEIRRRIVDVMRKKILLYSDSEDGQALRRSR
ncbi:hypothetical protein FOZ62_007536, partial [Perkinsus olseni]